MPSLSAGQDGKLNRSFVWCYTARKQKIQTGLFSSPFFLLVWSCCIWVGTLSQPFLQKWLTCPTSVTWSCVTTASKVSPRSSPGNHIHHQYLTSVTSSKQYPEARCVSALHRSDNHIPTVTFCRCQHFKVPLCLTQAPLTEISESPQQLTHLPAEGDSQPGAPARAQSPWQPTGGALCQGDDLRPPFTTWVSGTHHQEPKYSLLPLWPALKPAALSGPGQQVPQPQVCR